MSYAAESSPPLSDAEAAPLLSVRELRTDFTRRRSLIRGAASPHRAVDGVSFDIHPGETLGLVGESGCGKTTLARTILRLVPSTSGRVLFHGTSVLDAPGHLLRRLRREVQIIFQDPLGSLNARMRVGAIVGEPLAVHRVGTRGERRARVAALLERVGLRAADARRYPHEFSGGQRQRIGIARAIALNPKLVICDEPVSALDVSVQAQIINLLKDLQQEASIAYLFIAHNLAVVQTISQRVAVMYLGRIVEIGGVDELFDRPRHPYTMALLQSVLDPDPSRRVRPQPLPGEPPSPTNPPAGCAFHPRCPYATELCRSVTPGLERKASSAPEHLTACHHAEAIAAEPGPPRVTVAPAAGRGA